ncbi:hypothetical protein JAN5088_01900 [Jannaschia rubra]|uniref:Uncharacterized protein n=1 Tax=Jannaschia rubra TaxID=282197 RepID=A0A0M6XPP3_9RHOB|nr:hypothetical protein JAN5088_01900 [Jannaschia rubra]
MASSLEGSMGSSVTYRPLLDRPFIVLFEERRADEAGGGIVIRKTPTPLVRRPDLAVRTLDRSRGARPGTMLPRKGHAGRDVVPGVIHDVRQLRHLGTKPIGDGTPTGARGFGGVLSEGGGDEGRATRLPLLPAWAGTFRWKRTRQRCHVAHSIFVAAASMPLWGGGGSARQPGGLFARRTRSRASLPANRAASARAETRSGPVLPRMSLFPCPGPRGARSCRRLRR